MKRVLKRFRHPFLINDYQLFQPTDDCGESGSPLTDAPYWPHSPRSTMRYETLTLAVAVLLAVGASGAVAAPMSVTDTSPTPDAQPADYTVEVVDPDDRLTEEEVAELRRLAWSADEVRRQFDDAETVHFHVQAVGDSLEVYVATGEHAPPQVVAEIALDDETVTDVRALDNAMTTGAVESIDLSPVNESAFDDGSTVTVRPASGPTTLTVENSTVVEAVAVATVDDGNETVTVRTGGES